MSSIKIKNQLISDYMLIFFHIFKFDLMKLIKKQATSKKIALKYRFPKKYMV